MTTRPESIALIGAFTATGQIAELREALMFGDIFGRDNLDWPSREIATVAALARSTSACGPIAASEAFTGDRTRTRRG